ncbi:hypothetical protein NCAS_0H01740 [Naumovozyma castellii]|uniref:non-specific serine/threonine protein kinase n=1 Tax=Naumovozyma castellii TaxID=27288 RepID=G0VJ06_NAUCA|nr:hypothetical protein NCAS_0H01740 [Naumovozyma castellii CBS 4309]CCC71484.1 hypothetical protein NCAS_0H01740 [Naumovozyma castellii CBS 4309]
MKPLNKTILFQVFILWNLIQSSLAWKVGLWKDHAVSTNKTSSPTSITNTRTLSTSYVTVTTTVVPEFEEEDEVPENYTPIDQITLGGETVSFTVRYRMGTSILSSLIPGNYKFHHTTVIRTVGEDFFKNRLEEEERKANEPWDVTISTKSKLNNGKSSNTQSRDVKSTSSKSKQEETGTYAYRIKNNAKRDKIKRNMGTTATTKNTSSNLQKKSSAARLSSAIENLFEPTIHGLQVSKELVSQNHKHIGNSMKVPYVKSRTLDDLSLSNLLIAPDIEGGLHALSRTDGHVFWSIDSDQFQPLIHVEEPTNPQINETLIVEPFGDGNVYFFNIHQGLQKIPVTMRQLIATSPMHLKTDVIVDDLGTVIEDEKIYTGSRKTVMYTIDAKKGEIISVFGPDTENKNYRKDNLQCFKEDGTKNTDTEDCDNVIVIGKTIYQLGIHSKDGTTYNVTYASWQPNTLDAHLAQENSVSRDGIYIAPFRDKSLLAVDATLKIARWISPNYPGIVVGLFDVFNDENIGENVLVRHPFSGYDDKKTELSEKVYLDQSANHSWFALSSENFPSLVKGAPMSKYSSSSRWRVSSIFEDKNLFKTAIVGVHTLVNTKYRQLVERSVSPGDFSPSSAYDQALGLDPFSERIEIPRDDQSPTSLDRYLSPAELEAYRLKVQAEITREIMNQYDFSPFMVIGKFIYRIVESGLILLSSLFLLIILQKLNVAPPLHVLLEKIGILPTPETPFKEDEIPEVKIAEKLNPSKVDLDATTSAVNIHSNLGNGRENSGDEQDTNDGSGEAAEKKKRKRGSRGGKKNKKKSPEQKLEALEFEKDLKNLTVSDKILGYGSSGTVVFQGTFQNRPVAVKRMLIDFCDVASREIKLLTESDDHKNVIRYYCSETTEKFLYIALELCNATLQDVIEMKNPSDELRYLQQELDPIDILHQIASGVAHLHSLKIIHRDIKPQNILVAFSNKVGLGRQTEHQSVRIMISDFGLCKKLDADQSSFRTNLNNPAGTSGWRAPELLDETAPQILQTLNEEAEFQPVHASHQNGKHNHNNSVLSSDSFYDPFTKQRLTRAIDIFSMGCVFYYVLSSSHPFGDRYMREGNIIKGRYKLDGLKKSLTDRSMVNEASDLIKQMIANNPRDRLTAFAILRHPLFWPASKKLEFLLKVSDRLEIERREPPSQLLLELQEHADLVITTGDWTVNFDKAFMEDLGKYRKYHGDRLLDLLRVLRNKYHHFMEMPEELVERMGPIPDGFYAFFSRRFPRLLIELYLFVGEHLVDDRMLHEFFDN